MHLRWSYPVLVLIVCSCSVTLAQQDAPKSISQRIQQWMVGRMGLGGLPMATPLGLSPLSITGMSGLGGFFGMSPMTTGLLTLMGYGRPQAAQEHPVYVPAPPRYSSAGHRPASSHQAPVRSVAPPPPPPPPPSPSHYATASHYSSPTHYSSASHYASAPSPYKSHPAIYRHPRPVHYPVVMHHGAYMPGSSAPPRYVYRGPPLNGGFYKGTRGGRALTYGQNQFMHGIPIAIPRHIIKAPIGGPVAIKTTDGMMLGPFSRPVHMHGMPTVGQLPVTSGDLHSASTMHDFLSDSDLSLKDMIGVHEHDSMFQSMDDSLSSGSISADIFSDAMKDFDIGNDVSHMMIGDDIKTLDMKDNLLTASSTVRHRHPLLTSDSFLVSESRPHVTTLQRKRPTHHSKVSNTAILKSS